MTNVADQNLLPAWLAATLPDIVVMHFGTNDVWSSIAPDRILAAYTKLVDQMRATNPRHEDPRRADHPDEPRQLLGLRAARRRPQRADPGLGRGRRAPATRPSTVVDQWTGFSTATDTYDGVHPNAAGDEKIAARWYPALSSVLDAWVPGDPGDPGDPGGGQPACGAVFRATNVWQGGYQGEVTVTNTSASTVSGWTVTVVPAGGARLTQVWNGTSTTAADGTATVTNASWNGTLAPRASATFGFVATTSATAGTPSATVGCAARAAASS